MFEQSTLPSGPASKRLWATCVGVSGEAVLVVFAILAPMLWPQVLPRTTLITTLLPPVPQGRPKPAVERPRTAPASVRPTLPYRSAVVVMPARVPDRLEILVDPPPAAASGNWVNGGIATGVEGGVPNAVLDRILRPGSAPTPHIAEAPHPAAAPPAVAEIKQVAVGGRVKMAQVVHRVEPQYPAIARQMRVAGVVELVGVIAIDGRLKELRLVSGHPLLARAAIDAVSQWIYTPTTLNGETVEVIAPITVTFRLN